MGKFYLGMNYNGGGIEIARQLAPMLELMTGDKCVSRWFHSEAHKHGEFRRTIACSDVADIAQSDYVVLAPLSRTSRGTHVEMGLALGLDKPVYLYRPDGIDGVGFDALCIPWRPDWIAVLDELIAHAKEGGGRE